MVPAILVLQRGIEDAARQHEIETVVVGQVAEIGDGEVDAGVRGPPLGHEEAHRGTAVVEATKSPSDFEVRRFHVDLTSGDVRFESVTCADLEDVLGGAARGFRTGGGETLPLTA